MDCGSHGFAPEHNSAEARTPGSSQLAEPFVRSYIVRDSQRALFVRWWRSRHIRDGRASTSGSENCLGP